MSASVGRPGRKYGSADGHRSYASASRSARSTAPGPDRDARRPARRRDARRRRDAGDVDAQIARHGRATGTRTASAGTRSSTASTRRARRPRRPAPRPRRGPRRGRDRLDRRRPSAGARASRPSWAPRRSRVAFGPLGLADVVSFTLPDNRASRRVMEKLGFAYERDIELRRPAARALPAHSRRARGRRRRPSCRGGRRAAARRRGPPPSRRPRRAARPRRPAARRPRRSPSRPAAARARRAAAPRSATSCAWIAAIADVLQQRERPAGADPVEPRGREVEAARVGRQPQRRAVVGGRHVLARVPAGRVRDAARRAAPAGS